MLRATCITSGLIIGGTCFYNSMFNKSFCSEDPKYIPADVNKTYYKVLKKDLQHYNHLYKLGYNEDKHRFNPNGDCTSGGLYFCNFDDIVTWLTLYDDNEYIAEVKLLEDSKVVEQVTKFKTNKFFLQNVVLISEFLEKNNLQEKAVSISGHSIKYIKNPSQELSLAAIRRNVYSIQFIENPLPEVAHEAVMSIPFILQYIKNQTPELCLTAIRRNPASIFHVKELNLEICKEAFSGFKNIKYNTDDPAYKTKVHQYDIENPTSYCYEQMQKCKLIVDASKKN